MDFDRTAEYVNHHSEEEGKKMRKTIWLVFWILLGVTTVEVSLGLFWKDIMPASMIESGSAWEIVKWTFIILTLVKAYYIVAVYMHLKHEYKNFKLMVAVPYIVLALYLVIMCLIEAVYLHDTDVLM